MSIPKFVDVRSGTPDQLRRLLADRTRYERKRLKLTQQEFAEKCGVGFSTFRRFEAGTCDSLEVLLLIVSAFQRIAALDLLFPGEAPPARPRTLIDYAVRFEAKRSKSDT
jgi:transcriptional regulator with XRE-family HTH domain